MLSALKPSGHKTPWHLRILYLSTFLLRTAFGALLLLISAYVPGDEGTKLLAVAIIAVPYPLAEMLTANYFGTLSDRIGRKVVIVSGTATAAIVVALYSLSTNTWYLTGLHAIHGVAAAATVAPAIAMIADHAECSDRGRQMGWFDYSTFLGYIVGAVLGGFLIDANLHQLAFLIIAAMLGVSAVLLYKLVEVEKIEPRPRRSMVSELRQVFGNRQIRWVFPIWLIVATLLGIALTYLPIILLSQNVSGTYIGLMFAGAGVVLGLLQPFWGKVSDRVGRMPVMAYGVLSMFGVVVILLFFPSLVYSDNHINYVGLIPLGLMGLGVGSFVPSALAMMADSAEKGHYGSTMGLYSFALGFGAFIAESIGLAIILISGKNDAPSWLLYFAAALVGLAVLLMLFLLVTKAFNKKTQCEQ
jgi:MFS family permease